MFAPVRDLYASILERKLPYGERRVIGLRSRLEQ